MRELSGGLLVALIAALIAGGAFGQTASSKPAFEKADIHPAIPIQGLGVGRLGLPYAANGRYEIRNATMLNLITTAYSVDPERVVGGPSWLEWDHFDIIAAMPRDTSPETQKIMLQTLLADRFKLLIHNDTKDLTSYALTTGKSPKLKPAEGSGDQGCRSQIGGSGVTAMPGGGFQLNPTAGPITNTFTCRSMTMEAFATFLRPQVSQNNSANSASPVVDQTGLKGAWDFEFKTTLQIRLLNAANSDSSQITIFDAVDKQLGLKLTAAKTPLQVLAVDGATEKPTENLPGVAESLAVQYPKEFEVADVRPSAPAGQGPIPIRIQVKPGGGVNFSGLPLQTLVMQAYQVQGQQIIIPPDLQKEMQNRYDIIAKPPESGSVPAPAAGSANPSPEDNDAAWAMIRALLADRFKLVTHQEQRPGTAYKLIAVKPKMKKADPSERTKQVEGPGADGKDPRVATPARSRLSMFQNVTMKQFAAALPGISAYMTNGTVVEDATGLEGSYDFTINYSPVGFANRNINGGGRGVPEGANGQSAASEPDGGISLFEAIEQQLGLKLVEEKRPVSVFVIDHVEAKPTDN
jgi:uncharacterized protein (TIGR03435 family)